MLDDQNNQITTENKINELDVAIDNTIAALPLNEQEQKIVTDIINAPTKEDLEKQFDLFNITQSKKNALRVIKLNNLLGKIEDQAIKRFEKRPDNVSNKELLEYMQVVAGQIDRSQKYIDTLKDKPMIKVNDARQQQVNINIGTELSRDSKEKVIDAIQSLLKQLDKTAAEDNEENNIVDISPEEDEVENDVVENPLNPEEGEN